jgi:hypothetical protein
VGNNNILELWEAQRKRGLDLEELRSIPILYPNMPKGLPLVVGINPSGDEDENCKWPEGNTKEAILKSAIDKYNKDKQYYRYFKKFEQLLRTSSSGYNHVDLYFGRGKQREYLNAPALLEKREVALAFRDSQLKEALDIIENLEPAFIVVSNIDASSILLSKWHEELTANLSFEVHQGRPETTVHLAATRSNGKRVFFLPFLGNGYDNRSLGLWS